MRKEAIYARQSINKKDSVSIETQQAECAKIISGSCEKYSDRGYSGKNTTRPALQRLIADISADEPDSDLQGLHREMQARGSNSEPLLSDYDKTMGKSRFISAINRGILKKFILVL